MPTFILRGDLLMTRFWMSAAPLTPCSSVHW